MRLSTPIARARGLGSAKEGTRHWWAQRITAVALVPLSVWFVAVVLGLVGADYAAARQALASPLAATLGILLIVATFHHAQLGLQVVLEDYVHDERLKVAAIVVMKLAAVLLATLSVIAVLRLALGP